MQDVYTNLSEHPTMIIYAHAHSHTYRHPALSAVVDWDLYEAELSFAFKNLYTNPSEHPIMITDEAWSSPQQRRTCG